MKQTLTFNLAHTIRLYPNKAQETFFRKACSGCGAVREALLLSEREYVFESCGMVIDRDLNAAINLRNYGLNKIGKVIPELTPVEMEALSCSSTSETTVDEAGISECSLVNT